MKPVTKLMRRGYLLGYRRARRRHRAELNSLADEVEILRQDFAEVVELHHARDLEDEAMIERAMTPDELLN